ncbi:MAG: hypothetical protein PWQ52_1416 [Methanolobus sp.]|jgi:hypothetical protein|nr:hypothetical protein [Methanolobus sp.]
MPFMTAFIVHYLKFQDTKKASVTGIFSVLLFVILMYFTNLEEGSCSLIAGILGGLTWIFAYPAYH